MPQIVTIGEVLIDFTEEKSNGNIIDYVQNAGGSPANVSVMTSKLGISSAFIGKTGKDMFGQYLESVLEKNNVNISGLILDGEHPTTLAFVKKGDDGNRDFLFYRNDSSDEKLEYHEVNLKLIDSCSLLHFGAFSLTKEPTRSTVIKVVEYAKNNNKLISYSPNWRPSLWNSNDEAIRIMQSVLPLCDIVKVSEKELQIITDSANLITAVAKLLRQGITIVCVTQGAKGCIIATKNGIQRFPTYRLDTIDTLGAGDSFLGAFLAKIIQCDKPIQELSREELEDIAHYANACGALSANKHGAIPAMPTHEEILQCIGTIKTY